MAANVFGDPITDRTLHEMVEYENKEITQMDRARVALNVSYVNARTYVQTLKKQYGSGVSALCLVYNATGSTITFVESKDWHGHIYNENLAAAAPYPLRIQNGQWGAFLHVHPTATAYGSMGAAVYRGKDAKGEPCDYMMAWLHPWGAESNSVYIGAREVDHFKENWGEVRKMLERDNNRAQYTDMWNGCWSTISTGSDASATVEARFTLLDAA